MKDELELGTTGSTYVVIFLILLVITVVVSDPYIIFKMIGLWLLTAAFLGLIVTPIYMIIKKVTGHEDDEWY